MPKTIILHGTGRSGTSMLNNIMVNHPDLAWISNYQVYALKFPQISFANRFVKHSVDLNNKYRNKFLIHSSNEPYALWQKFYPNFNEPGAKPIGDPYQLEKYTQRITKFAGKKSFVTKITGQSRADFIRHAFTDYVVVWIDRDPIAVVSSMMKQRWFYKNNEALFKTTPVEERIKRYVLYYKNSLNSKSQIDSNRLIEVWYEDLVGDSQKFFTKLLRRLDLPMDQKFIKQIKNWNIKPVGKEKYENDLSSEELELIKSLLK